MIMLTLYLFRHEKAEPSMMSDFTRILTDTGRKRAADTTRLFKEIGYELPQVIFASTAVRAQETAAIFIKNSGYAGKLRNCEELYSAGAEDIMEFLAKNAGTAQTVMIVAHNPALESLAGRLLGMGTIMKPGHMAAIRLDMSSWSEDYIAKGKLIDLLRAED